MPDHVRPVFGPFRLDLRDERLWRGQDAVPLSHKAFAVLRCLVSQPGLLVTKDMLLTAVWPDTAVSEAVLVVAARELRRALGDQARTPQYIETVHRRGYRFIAPVTAEMSTGRDAIPASSPLFPLTASALPATFVGREAELTQLHQWFTRALQGERQIGFITGEAGIGKTALVDAFVAHVRATEDLWVGHGQCIDHYGAGEAYLPLLEAIGRLCRGPDRAHLVPILRQHAPSWVRHIPVLLTAREREVFLRQESEVTRERMLRELAEAVEIATAERPLLLVVEDLQWSDMSTLEWLTYIARRRDPARLIVLSTYRPDDAVVYAHPVRPMMIELLQHGQCMELALTALSEAAISVYCTQQLGSTPVPADIVHVLHQRTNGNPLFLVTVVHEFMSQQRLEATTAGWCLEAGGDAVAGIVPDSLRLFIEQRIEQLAPEEQAILDAASIVGSTFAVAAVAAGLAYADDFVEACCTAWVRQGRFLQNAGVETWPDGTVSACYRFIHALYHEVVYARVSAAQRVRLHQQIGARKEAGYGSQARDIAAELAMHFVRGREPHRAVQYLRLAGENAVRRSAHQEAIAHLTQGLELLTTRPDMPEGAQHEVHLQTLLGAACMATKGYAAPEVEHAFARARALCETLGHTPRLFAVLWGLAAFYQAKGDVHTAKPVAQQCLTLARRGGNRSQRVVAHFTLGNVLWSCGELARAFRHLERAWALYPLQFDPALRTLQDLGGIVQIQSALAVWALGYVDQALARSAEALRHARQHAQPFSLAWVLSGTAVLHQYRGEAHATQERADEVERLATEQGFPYWHASATLLRGWACSVRGHGATGVTLMQQGLEAYRTTGALIHMPYFLALLAEGYAYSGQVQDGLYCMAEALTAMATTGVRVHEADLYRRHGELLMAPQAPAPRTAGAESRFRQALTFARRQQAKSYELRAATSLAHLWQQQGKRSEARELLAPVYGWFTEGFDTADLKDAAALLEELSA